MGEAERAQTDGGASEAPHRNNWRVLLVLFVLAGIVESQAFGHLNAFTPIFLQELRVPFDQIATWTGILSSLGFVIGLPLLPFWGVWADKYSRKLIIVRSAYVEGLLFLIAAISPNVWFFAVARFLSGFVLGNTGVMLALLADVTPRKRLGVAVGLASAGFPIGASVGPYIGGLVTQQYGVRALLAGDAIASLLVGLLLTLMVREEPRVRSVVRTVGALLGTAFRDIVTSPVTLRLFTLYFLAMFGISLATPFAPLLIRQFVAQNDPSQLTYLATIIGTTLTAAGIAMAITTPLWGRLGDLIGRWRVLPICLAAIALSLAAEALAPSLLPFQAAVVVAGLFQGGIGTTIIALLAVLAPLDRRATILNFSLLPSQLSWFLAPILGAGLATVSLRLPYGVGAGAAALAVLMAIFLARRQGNAPTLPADVPATEQTLPAAVESSPTA